MDSRIRGNDTMEDIIIKLQEALFHQGEDIARLSDELYAQQKEISSLNSQVEKLKAKIKSLDDGSYIRKPEEETPPPHY